MALPRAHGVKEVVVRSITEFARAVEKLLPQVPAEKERAFEGNWYRGVGMGSSHKLTPGLFRHSSFNNIEDFLRLEHIMLQDFRRQSVLHSDIQTATTVDADFRTLFVMQHYGVPTRLLDWSTNPFIALYFALSSVRPEQDGSYAEDAAVWVLDPTAWNKVALSQNKYGDRGPLWLNQAEADAYKPKVIINGKVAPGETDRMFDAPSAILGIANNARMFAQRGVFTVFGRDTSSMEDQFEKHRFPTKCLTKLVVPKGYISELLVLLIRLGYTDSVSYPDLQGLATEIKRLRGFKV